MSSDAPTHLTFRDLHLDRDVLQALEEIGYDTPTPIQSRTIPSLLQGRDVLGQAQTGTGKTAAFALPLLCQLDLRQRQPQALILTPTRELAIQVARSFERYASAMKGFRVVPIYGGQSYEIQLRPLQRGVHVVVGTPGRVMDHMQRGTLRLDGLHQLVLDEADEMLRMGFLEDMEWILERIPMERQTALFSATMPDPIRRVARQHLNDPVEIRIQTSTAPAETIRQRYWIVRHGQKLDVLTRILEVEPIQSVLVFVRTKIATIDLAEKLEALGHPCAALHGDIPQRQRERTIERLKSGHVKILAATDVAARGLDLDRVSHVVNYDMPFDTEAYVHRIGRTGRAGKSGEAILFATPRERRMLRAIEKTTGGAMETLKLPSDEEINGQRIQRFKERIAQTLEKSELGLFEGIVEEFMLESGASPAKVAAALAHLAQGDRPLLLESPARSEPQGKEDFERNGRFPTRNSRSSKSKRPFKEVTPTTEAGMERFRIEVGHRHQVSPKHIVGAIANEAGLPGKHIGRIEIYENFSTVDLPEGMPKDVFHTLKAVRVSGQRLRISRLDASDKPHKPHKGGGFKKKDKKGKPFRSKAKHKP